MKQLFPIAILLLFLVPQNSQAEPWQNMKLVGSGEYNYLGFITLYQARLFTDGDQRDTSAPQASRCLVLDYEVEILDEQFAEAAEAILLRQLATPELEHIKPYIAELHANYRTVGEGDRYSLCFDGQTQTTSLALNGENLVSIHSSEFAAAYFNIWLGEREPIDRGLRDDLVSAEKDGRGSNRGES